MGAELEKGRNLLAETSGGQIWKGPKPLATFRKDTNVCYVSGYYLQYFTILQEPSVCLLLICRPNSA